MSEVRVLVVERRESDARLTEKRLKGLGYSVCGAASSDREAVAIAYEKRPQVALVGLAEEDDYDPIEVARQMRNLDMPVLFMTDGAQCELLERARTVIPSGYLVKPIEERQCRLTIDAAIGLHRGQSALIERSRRLSRILDHVDAGVIAIDIGGFITFVNPLAEGLLQWRQTELVGEQLSDVFQVVADDQSASHDSVLSGADIVSNVLQEGTRLTGAAGALNAKTGQQVPVSFHAAPLRDAQRNCIGAVMVLRPGTKAQELEHELKRTVIRQQSRLRLMETVFESLSDGVAVADRDGHMLLANQVARDMVGGVNADGKDVRQWSEIYGIYHADEKTPVPSHEMAIVRATRGEATDGAEIFIRNASKRRGVHVSVSGRPLQVDLDDRPSAGVIVMRDISERKAAEKKLQETVVELSQQTQLMQAIFDAMSDGVVVADEKGQFTLFNPAAERIVGIGMTDSDPDQWTSQYGIFYNDRTTPVPTDELPLVRAIRGETTDEMEMFIRNESKPEGVHLSASGRPILGSEEAQGGVIIFRDVTQKVRAEEALAQAFAQGRLEVMDTILHNIGNAINSVAIGVGNLQKRLAQNPLLQQFTTFSEAVRMHVDDWNDYVQHHPEGQQVLQFLLEFGDALVKQNRQLLRTVERANNQANHIVDIVRTQRGFGNYATYKDIDLRQAVTDALKLLQEAFARRHLRPHLSFGNAPKEIRVQESQFHQMLVNLFKNAIEATDEQRQSDGLWGPPRVELRTYVQKGFLVLDVIDNGIGIPEKNLREIFAAGYTTKPKGSGLGLHSTANFVTSSGGKVRPLSDGAGQGTTMRVMLRLAVVCPGWVEATS